MNSIEVETEEQLVADQEVKKKPAPLRRASETLKTDAKNKLVAAIQDEGSNEPLTPSHIAEGK